MSIIYKTTNLVNGKIYIGQHCTSSDDGYFGSGKITKLAIKKYGKENFARETLEYCSKENVDEREIYWIAELSASNHEIGYNIHEGGTGGNLYERTESHRKHLSDIFSVRYLGENNPNFGNKWTEDQKEHLRQINTGKELSVEHKRKISKWNQVNGNPFKGKTHSVEQKEKWSRDRKGTRLGKENSFFGKTHSNESKKLISKSSKLRTKYIYFFIDPNGIKYENITNLKDFCKPRGWKQNNLYFVHGKWTKYKGWKIKRELKGCI